MVIHVVISHIESDYVDEQLCFLEKLNPDNEYVLAYGGTKKNFDRVKHENKVFIADETLRGCVYSQSYNEVLTSVYKFIEESNFAKDYVYFSEYDHLIFKKDYSESLVHLLEENKLDFLGKNCFDVTDTGWIHHLRYRNDRDLLDLFRSISVREDKTRFWGILGDGFFMRYEVLENYTNIKNHHKAYFELYIPSIIHHLGYNLGNYDDLCDLYENVSHVPNLSLKEVFDLMKNGKTFYHPFKQKQYYKLIYDAVLYNNPTWQ